MAIRGNLKVRKATEPKSHEDGRMWKEGMCQASGSTGQRKRQQALRSGWETCKAEKVQCAQGALTASDSGEGEGGQSVVGARPNSIKTDGCKER